MIALANTCKGQDSEQTKLSRDLVHMRLGSGSGPVGEVGKLHNWDAAPPSAHLEPGLVWAWSGRDAPHIGTYMADLERGGEEPGACLSIH